MSKIIIVGAGASGLVSAILLKRKGLDVTILEKNSVAAKKLLLTGNGKCNYFNENMDLKCYHSTDRNLLSEFINQENINKVSEFFHSIGLISRNKNGYLYPYSNTSLAMKSILLTELKLLNVEIIYDTYVIDVKKEEQFIINTNNGEYKCDKLILATGSLAGLREYEYSSYDILKNWGHTIVDVLPALVQITMDAKYLKDWNGIRCDAKVSLYEDNVFIDEEEGELQLTDYGLSGICIMNLSHYISKGLLINKKEVIKINFIPFVSDIEKFLEERANVIPNYKMVEFLESILNYKLAGVILEQSKIDKNKTYYDLTDKEIDKLIKNLSEFEVNITGVKDLVKAQVVSGGLKLSEVKANLESKLVDNLYVAGELLDVDGICGGYNLGFAWICATIIGSAIND